MVIDNESSVFLLNPRPGNFLLFFSSRYPLPTLSLSLTVVPAGVLLIVCSIPQHLVGKFSCCFSLSLSYTHTYTGELALCLGCVYFFLKKPFEIKERGRFTKQKCIKEKCVARVCVFCRLWKEGGKGGGMGGGWLEKKPLSWRVSLFSFSLSVSPRKIAGDVNGIANGPGVEPALILQRQRPRALAWIFKPRFQNIVLCLGKFTRQQLVHTRER